MNKSEIIESIAESEKIEIEIVKKILSRFFSVIEMKLCANEMINIREFGTFEVRHRNATIRRNPKTGDPVSVPAKVSFGFVASPILKKRINANYEAK